MELLPIFIIHSTGQLDSFPVEYRHDCALAEMLTKAGHDTIFVYRDIYSDRSVDEVASHTTSRVLHLPEDLPTASNVLIRRLNKYTDVGIRPVVHIIQGDTYSPALVSSLSPRYHTRTINNSTLTHNNLVPITNLSSIASSKKLICETNPIVGDPFNLEMTLGFYPAELYDMTIEVDEVPPDLSAVYPGHHELLTQEQAAILIELDTGFSTGIVGQNCAYVFPFDGKALIHSRLLAAISTSIPCILVNPPRNFKANYSNVYYVDNIEEARVIIDKEINLISLANKTYNRYIGLLPEAVLPAII